MTIALLTFFPSFSKPLNAPPLPNPYWNHSNLVCLPLSSWLDTVLIKVFKNMLWQVSGPLFYLRSPGPLCCFWHSSILCLNILSFHSFCNSVFFWFSGRFFSVSFDGSSSTPLSKDPNRIPSLPPLLPLLPLGDLSWFAHKASITIQLGRWFTNLYLCSWSDLVSQPISLTFPPGCLAIHLN